MKKTLLTIFFLTIISVANSLAGEKIYVVPPSSSTTNSNIPYISDEAMKECVLLYNEIEWLAKEIKNTQVNKYSQASVDAYNKKIMHHKDMIKTFNRDCAGKQSESAYKAAQELNEKKKTSKTD